MNILNCPVIRPVFHFLFQMMNGIFLESFHLFIPADAQRFVCLWSRQRISHSLDINYYLFVFPSKC